MLFSKRYVVDTNENFISALPLSHHKLSGLRNDSFLYLQLFLVKIFLRKCF